MPEGDSMKHIHIAWIYTIFKKDMGDREVEKNWICFIIESFNLVVTSPLDIISNHMWKLPCFLHSNKKHSLNSFLVVPMFLTKKDESYG